MLAAVVGSVVSTRTMRFLSRRCAFQTHEPGFLTTSVPLGPALDARACLLPHRYGKKNYFVSKYATTRSLCIRGLRKKSPYFPTGMNYRKLRHLSPLRDAECLHSTPSLQWLSHLSAPLSGTFIKHGFHF